MKKVTTLLNQGPWDFVILQDFSRGTTTPQHRAETIQCLTEFFRPAITGDFLPKQFYYL